MNLSKEEIKKSKKFVNKEMKLLNKQYDLIKKEIEIRNKKNLSQRELCELVGMSQPSLAKIEKNINSPTILTMLKILEPMGYTLSLKKIN